MEAKIIQALSQRIGRLDFNQLWLGLQRFPFALVGKESVFHEDGRIIEKDQRFVGNTSIDFETSQLAIWQLEDPIDDLDEWAALMVHEMVHANQRIKQESRFVDDLRMLEYPQDLSNVLQKHQENQWLVNKQYSDSEKLKRIISSRQQRYLQLLELSRAETNLEVIEGVAEYVTLQALTQLDANKGKHYLEKLRKQLIEPSHYFDIRRQSYFSGALIIDLIEKLKIPLNKAFDEPRTFYEQLEDQVQKVPVSYEPNQTIEWKFHQYQQHLQSIVQERTKPVKSNQMIVGYDPMNMVKVDHYIIATSFIMLSPPQKPQFVSGPLLLEMDPQHHRQVLAYYALPKETTLTY